MPTSRLSILILFLCVTFLLCSPGALAQQWVVTYAGHGYAADAADVPSGMVVDAGGDAYISGTTRGLWSTDSSNYLVVKYNADGSQQWIRSIGHWMECMRRSEAIISAPVLDGDHNICVVALPPYCHCIECPATFADYHILKYSPAGSTLLDITYEANAWGQTVPVVQTDAAGNLYVAGTSWHTNDSVNWAQDILLLKYEPSGALLWERRQSDSSAYAMVTDPSVYLAVDSAGNAFVASSQDPDSTGADIVVMKYDTDGNLLWFERYDYPWAPDDHGVEEAYALRLGLTGNIYVVGRSTAPWDCSDCTVPSTPVLLKYDTDGTLLWDIQFDMNLFSDIGLDVVGNVVLAGRNEIWGCGGGGLRARVGNTGSGDYIIQKRDPEGSLLWEQIYDDGDSLYDEATALAVDASGNVFLTGKVRGSGGCPSPGAESDYGTIMLDPDGNLRWERSFAGPALLGTDVGVGVDVDAVGDVYVTGYCWGDSTHNDFATLKYHPCGMPMGAFGDMNEDSVLTSADIIYLVAYVFKGGPSPPICEILGDVNNDGPVTSADVIYMVNHVFKSGPPPVGGDPCDHPLVGTCP